MTVIYDFSQFCFGCLVPLMVFEWLSFFGGVFCFHIFDCHSCVGVTCILWLEAPDVGKHATVHRTAPTATNYLAQHIYSAEVINSVNQYF